MHKSVVFALVVGLGCLMLASCRSRGSRCCPCDTNGIGTPDVVGIDDVTPADPKDAVVGTYELDSDSLVQAVRGMLAPQLEAMHKALAGLEENEGDLPADQLEEQMASLRAQIEAMESGIEQQAGVMASAMKITIEIKGDGSWTGLMTNEGESKNAGGTWELGDDGKLIMHETISKGTPENPDTQEFEVADGAIIMQPPGAPFSIRLLKQ